MYVGGVDDYFVVVDVVVVFSYIVYGLYEEVVWFFYDVVFVDEGDVFVFVFVCDVEGVVGDVFVGVVCDDFVVLYDVGNDFVFDVFVDVFGVFVN